MIAGKKILAIIPARGGSKRIPKKNIKPLAGKPLIAWTIEEAKKSQYIDRLILSSDDDDIISVAQSYGCEVPFVRPKSLATDTTAGIEPVLHALELITGFDFVLLLQPTSPLRRASDIDNCIELYVKSEAPCCVGLTEVTKNPYWMYELTEENKIKPLLDIYPSRHQNLPKTYSLNGALYIAKVKWLLEKKTFVTDETLGFVMPQDRSLDIDNPLDMEMAELLLEAKNEIP